ncbi:uncharacterized protein LOC142356679 isoform X2 [Convolutriloba macropyga]|uniref:uncharacterized protein LOC142356679 isoform X2 n=1 Tax=Convolutriloba macropyga TaxID=536237 RepID=UPI003F525BE8
MCYKGMLTTLQESIKMQLDYLRFWLSNFLNTQDSNNQPVNTRAKLTILIWFRKLGFQKNLNDCKNLCLELSAKFSKTVQLFANELKIDIEFDYVVADQIVKMLATETSSIRLGGNSAMSALLNSEIENDAKKSKMWPYFKYYSLTKSKLRTYNQNLIVLSDVEAVLEIVRSYFPNQFWKHYVVPDLDCIPETLLDKTTESGKVAANNEIGAYVGELKLFWEKLAPEVGRMAGAFLKSWKNVNLWTLLDERTTRPSTFEIDWIHCGLNGITGFEVGTILNPSNPNTALQNKLEQVFTTILPQFLLILHTFFTFYYESSNELPICTFDHFISEFFTLLIYLPQLKLEQLLKVQKSWKFLPAQVFIPLSQTPEAHISRVKFLVQDRMGKFQAVQIVWTKPGGKTFLDYVPGSKAIFENFRKKKFEEETNPAYKLVQYINALFIIGSHRTVFRSSRFDNYHDNFASYDELISKRIDIDYRYLAASGKKPPSNIVTKFGIILSPEQLKILTTKETYLALFGPPGTGKSLLLLAKADELAQEETIECVIYAYEKTRTFFDTWLREMIDRYASDKLKAKIKIELTGYRQLFEEDLRKYREIEPSRIAVMVDEIYGDQYFAFQSTKLTSKAGICWMACIETGQREVLNMFPYNNKLFAIRKLHILYRSCHLVSEFSNNFLDGQILSYECATMIPGCFTSTQTEFNVQFYENLDDNILLTNDIKIDSKFAKDRLFIIFTDRANPESTCLNMFGNHEGFQPEKFCIQTSKEMELRLLKFTGSEFNSVLVVIDFDEILPLYYMAFHLAITRAQFEVSVYIKNKLKSEELLKFLKPERSSVNKVLDSINIEEDFSDKLNQMPASGVLKLRNYLNFRGPDFLIKRLPKFGLDVSLRFILLWGSENFVGIHFDEIISAAQTNGLRRKKPKKSKGTEMPAHNNEECQSSPILQILNKLDDEELKPLNLLLYAIVSADMKFYNVVTTILRNRDLLEYELNKIFSDGHTILTFLSMQHDLQFAPSETYENRQLNFLEKVLTEENISEEILLHEFRGKNAYQWSLYFCSLNAVRILLSSPERCQIFMKSMGYNEMATEDEIAEKYLPNIRKSQRGLLYSAAHTGHFDQLKWAIDILKNFKYLLNIEMGRVYEEKWNHTILIVYCRSANATKEGVELIMDNHFPLNLLKVETAFYEDRCNALDRAIMSKNVEVIKYLISDPLRKSILLKKDKVAHVEQLIAEQRKGASKSNRMEQNFSLITG